MGAKRDWDIEREGKGCEIVCVCVCECVCVCVRVSTCVCWLRERVRYVTHNYIRLCIVGMFHV